MSLAVRTDEFEVTNFSPPQDLESLRTSDVSHHFDVVIIGFGPTGATLANLLGLTGVRTLLLDRAKGSCALPRAVHFDGEVMRVFQTIGVSDRIAKCAIVNAGMRFVNKDTEALLLDWSRPQEIGEHGWYPSYRFHQPDLERELHNNLIKFPSVEIRTGCEAQVIREEKEAVHVHYEELDSKNHVVVSGKFVVGCEGTHSLTRKLIGEAQETPIEDYGYNQPWLVVDVILHREKPELSDYTIQYCHSESPVTSARGPGLRRRWEFALTEQGRDQPIDEPFIWEQLSPWLDPEEAILERFAVYEFHSSIALNWRKDRLFVAGDAAHQTPPFLGQGMCAGIRDAANLAWKLALSLKGNTNPSVLDSYEQERIDHVRSYITTAIDLGQLINRNNNTDLYEKLNAPDGKMKSIAPTLGKGLAIQENTHVGSICPQPTLTRVGDHPTFLDDHCGYAPNLLIDSKGAEELSDEQSAVLNRYESAGLCVVNSDSEPHVAALLKQLQLNALLTRPDRYILASSTNSSELQTMLDQVPLVMPAYP